MIGAFIRPLFRVKLISVVSAIYGHFEELIEFLPKRFIVSSWSQKTFDRTLKELSTGTKIKSPSYVDGALRRVFGVEVIVNGHEDGRPVEAARSGRGHRPVERVGVPVGRRHGPAAEEGQQVRQRLQSDRLQGARVHTGRVHFTRLDQWTGVAGGTGGFKCSYWSRILKFICTNF
jgi:hypothetical protein